MRKNGDVLAAQAELAHQVAHGYTVLASAVGGLADVIRSGAVLGEEDDRADVANFVEVIQREVSAQFHSAMNLLGQFLPDLAGNLLRPDIVRAKPIDLLEEMLPGYEAVAARRGIDVVVERASEEMPNLALERHAMRRTFHNVLSNAIKYSYSGLGAHNREVRIWSRRHDMRGDSWSIRVQNYGVGVMPHELRDIFGVGYRGEMARRENTLGAGLGLADVRKSMESHGGTAYMRSKREHGVTYVTTLTLVFPRRTHFD